MCWSSTENCFNRTSRRLHPTASSNSERRNSLCVDGAHGSHTCVVPQRKTVSIARHEDYIQQHRATQKDGTRCVFLSSLRSASPSEAAVNCGKDSIACRSSHVHAPKRELRATSVPARVETGIWSCRNSLDLLYVLVVLETLSVPDATRKEGDQRTVSAVHHGHFAPNGRRHTCARRCTFGATLLRTEHSPSPSAMMSQARGRPSRRFCFPVAVPVSARLRLRGGVSHRSTVSAVTFVDIWTDSAKTSASRVNLETSADTMSSNHFFPVELLHTNHVCHHSRTPARNFVPVCLDCR